MNDDMDDEVLNDFANEATQGFWASPQGIREQVRQWHVGYPKCGMGGCDSTPCPHGRTCRCVGGRDECGASILQGCP